MESGSLFVAVKGERVDGHEFLDRVVAAGAAAVVLEQRAPVGSIPSVRVRDSRAALGILGSRFYRDPSAALRMIGVTGTNGKTTTTYIVKTMLEAASRRVGLIGTVGYLVGKESFRPPIRRRALWSCSACLHGWCRPGWIRGDGSIVPCARA